MTDRRVVAFGETLIDIVQEGGSRSGTAGGSPMNVAVALARQGYPTAVVSPVSDDHYGDLIREHLRLSGVDTSLLIPVTSYTTTAILHHEGQKTKYVFSINGYSQGEWTPEHIVGKARDGDILTVSGSFALAVEPMASVFEKVMSVGAQYHTVVFDPNIRTDVIGDSPDRIAQAKDRFDRWCALATIVKASDEDIAWRFPDLDVVTAGQQLAAQGTPLVVITCGEHGAYAFHGGEVIHLAGDPVSHHEFGDTVGAGDTLNAGMLSYLLDHDCVDRDDILAMSSEDVYAAVASGQALAREVCKVVGANPPWKDTLSDDALNHDR